MWIKVNRTRVFHYCIFLVIFYYYYSKVKIGTSWFRRFLRVWNRDVPAKLGHLAGMQLLLVQWSELNQLFIFHTQGLTQDFKTACPTQRQFQNDPSNAFWELVFTPLANPEVKNEYDSMEAPLIGNDRHYNCTCIVYKVTRIHPFRKQYKDFDLKLYRNNFYIKYVDICSIHGVVKAGEGM